ncbi:MAG TPA: ATP-binding protein [Anaeromyxobacter sp.]|nr:ATP-binding protein [Anaeromyxobacter sp.]
MVFDEGERLRILREYEILDTPEEEAFDEVVQIASRFFRAPTVLVTLVDEARQWFKAHKGFALRETPREWSFCAHAVAANAPLVVTDALADPRFAANPLVTGDPRIRFYAGVPIRSAAGIPLGTICLIDQEARQMPPEALESLAQLARLVEDALELRRRLHQLEALLGAARDERRSRELLVAMVVHDLRGPLTAIDALASVVEPFDPGSEQLLRDLVAESGRMRALLADVLDLCLAEIGGLRLRPEPLRLDEQVRLAAGRLERPASRREQSIRVVTTPVEARADRRILERVLENLVGNAIQHGPAGQTIEVRVAARPAGGGRCEVDDAGRPIPEGMRDEIFGAFERLPDPSNPPAGYGLPLAFCKLAVEAHGGRIGVTPGDVEGNSFWFELPASPPDVPAPAR